MQIRSSLQFVGFLFFVLETSQIFVYLNRNDIVLVIWRRHRMLNAHLLDCTFGFSFSRH